MHVLGSGSIKAFVVGLAAAVVLLVTLAQFELISHSASKVNHKVGKALDRLDLNKPAGDFFSFVGRAKHSGSGGAAASMKGGAKSGAPHDEGGEGRPEKVGAGFLFTAPGGQVLLLKRRSKHNDSTWGLPGGNMDAEDGGDLLATAKREAIEEMGSLPSQFTIKGSVLTQRGKRKQKHYTVYVAELTSAVQQQYQPQLDPTEHSEWRWFQLPALIQLQQQAAAVEDGGGALGGVAVSNGAAAGSSQAGGGTEGVAGVELHPVVGLLVGPQHVQALQALVTG